MVIKHKHVTEYKNEILSNLNLYIRAVELEAERRAFQYFAERGFGYRSTRDSVLAQLGVYSLREVLDSLNRNDLSESDMITIIGKLNDFVKTTEQNIQSMDYKNIEVLDRFRDLVESVNRFKISYQHLSL